MGSHAAATLSTHALVRDCLARGDLEQAGRLARQVAEDRSASEPQRAAAALLWIQCLYRRADIDEMIAVRDAALDCAEGAAGAGAAFEIRRLVCLALSDRRRYGEALRASLELQQLAGTDPQRQALAQTAQAACFERMGDPWQALRLLDPLLDQAAVNECPAVRLRVLAGQGGAHLAVHGVLSEGGDTAPLEALLKQATDQIVEALGLAELEPDPWVAVVLRTLLSDARLRAGDLEAAEREADRARADAVALGVRHLERHARCILSEVRLARGEADQAGREMADMLAEQPGAVSAWSLRLPHLVAYKASAAQGDTALALFHLEQVHRIERQRLAEQMRAQARELVSRVEVENAMRQVERVSGEAREHRRRADALADAVMKDALTGVLNRRGLAERLDGLRRQAHRIAVAMLDVDHFKRVNDSWGHAVGDQVLVQLGVLLREQVRPRDAVARYGGEEFVLLLDGLTAEEAFDVCERLRSRVESTVWDPTGAALRLTVSIGLALGGTADSAVDAAALLGPADAALYRAKAAGRNRIEVASPTA